MGDLNLLIFFFLIIFFNLITNVNNALNLLLIAELLWITLYSIVLFLGLIYDNLNLLSLTFFFLVFSAVELALGLVLLLFQNIINRSINLLENDTNFTKFNFRFSRNLYTNKMQWKL